MKLKYQNGQIVQEGFNGSYGPMNGTKYDVRLDALKLPDYRHNEKVAMEQALKNMAYQKEQEIKRKIHAAKLRAENKYKAEAVKRAKAFTTAQAKYTAEAYSQTLKKHHKALSEKFIPTDTTQRLTKNPLAGFGSGEGEVYYTGPSHKIKADFDMLKIERVERPNNTELTQFIRSENDRLNQNRVEKAVGKKPIPGQGAFPKNGVARPGSKTYMNTAFGRVPFVPAYVVSGAHPLAAHSLYFYQQGMGICCGIRMPSWDEVTRAVSRPFEEIGKAISQIRLPEIRLPEIRLPEIKLPTISEIGDALARPFNEVGKALNNINWPKVNLPTIKIPTISELARDIGNAAGHLLNSDLNPVMFAQRTFENTPGLRDIYREVDNFTGGALTSVKNINTMPSRALRGEAISQADFMDAVTFAVKVGLTAFAGPVGSTAFNAALIGTAAGQLKKGPLGQTDLGRTLLSVGEVAGLATAAGQNLTTIASNKAKEAVVQEASKKAGAAGAILAVAATGKVENPESSFISNAMTAAEKEAKNMAVVELQKKTGIPVTLATQMVDGKVPTTSDVEKAIILQAKTVAATEFEKKTGVPVTLAEKIVKGDVPSMSEIKEKAYTDLAHAPEALKEQLAVVKNQIQTAPQQIKVVLEEKKKVLTETINNREALVAQARAEGAAKMSEARQKVDDAVNNAEKMRLTQKEIKDKADELLARAMATGNEKLKEELMKQVGLLMKQVLGINGQRVAAEEDAREAINDADELREELALEELAIEHGAKDPARPGKFPMGLALGVGAAAAGVGVLMMGGA